MLPAPELISQTTASIAPLPCIDLDGSLTYAIIVKQRFLIQETGNVERTTGTELVVADEPWDKADPESSIRYPSDLVLRKPGTDIVIAGSAWAPDGGAARSFDVYLRVGAREKHLRVHGPRVWYRSGLALSLTAPEPAESVPLKWELAWGGNDTTDDGRRVEEKRNPAGRGIAADPKKLVHQLGPQIEDPHDPISSSRGRHVPVGVGAIGRVWSPRREYAGTHDAEWERTRLPLRPLDYDERFEQSAPPDQVFMGHLTGGEPVTLGGMLPGAPIRFEIPHISFFVGVSQDGQLREYPPKLDSIVLIPGERLMDIVWRSQYPIPRAVHRMDYVQVHEKRSA